MTKEPARKTSTTAFLVQFLYGAAIGLCGVHSLMAAVEASASFGQYLFCVVWMLCVLAAAGFLQILLHEGGHLVCGLLSGYRFVSYRIGSWMVQRENGVLRVHRFSLAGTAGQCLMTPPDITNWKMPYKLYNAGGVLDNLMLAAQAMLQANRLMDAQRFAETARAIDTLTAQSTALLPLHRELLLCDRLTCALLTEEDAAPFAKQWNSRELQAFRKQMKSYPSVLRTEFAVALLVEKDTARAEKLRARLERVLCTYPYAAEAAAERSLLQKLEALGK